MGSDYIVDLNLTKCQRTREIGSLYQGFIILLRFCSTHFKRLGWRILFIIARTLLPKSSLNRGAKCTTRDGYNVHGDYHISTTH